MSQQSVMKQVTDICREIGIGEVVSTHVVQERANWLPTNRVSAALAQLARRGDLDKGGMVAGIRQYTILEQIVEEREEKAGWEGQHSHPRASIEAILPEEIRGEVQELLLDGGVLVEGDRIDAAMDKVREAYYLLRDNRRR